MANQSFEFVRWQHENLLELIGSCLNASDPVFRRQAFAKLAQALVVHNAIEREVFFPFMAYQYGDDAVEEAGLKNMHLHDVLQEMLSHLDDDAHVTDGLEDALAILRRHIYLVETNTLTPSDSREPDFMNDFIEIGNMMKHRARQIEADQRTTEASVERDNANLPFIYGESIQPDQGMWS